MVAGLDLGLVWYETRSISPMRWCSVPCIGLAIRVADEHEALHAFNWLIAHAGRSGFRCSFPTLSSVFIRQGEVDSCAMTHRDPSLGQFIEETLSVLYA